MDGQVASAARSARVRQLSGRALEGVRVVALEHAVAGPLCSRHLADLGAEVIKVERPPGGDLARAYDAVVHGWSTWFVWLNRGKQSLVLDLGREADRGVLDELLSRSDVLLTNLGPGAQERLGLSAEVLQGRWPGLVTCRISGYGPGGPDGDRKAFDLLLQGEAALLSVTGSQDQPAKVGISVADISAGMYALVAILAALRERDRDGRGRHIEISMLDCLAEWMTVPMYHQMYGDGAPIRAGARHNLIVPYGAYPVGDGGLVNLAVQTEAQWRRFCATVLGQPELALDPRFATNDARRRNRTSLEPLIEACFATRSAEEVITLLAAADVPFGAVNDVAGLVRHPQLRSRDRWRGATVHGRPVAYPAPPFLPGASDAERPATVPCLGEHDAEATSSPGVSG